MLIRPWLGMNRRNIVSVLLSIDSSLTFFKDFRNTNNLIASYAKPYDSTANSGTKIISPFNIAVPVVGNVSVPGGGATYMQDGRQFLLQKSGLIRGVNNLYIATIPAAMRLAIYTEGAASEGFGTGAFIRTAYSEDFAASLSVGLNNITFATPIQGTVSGFFALEVTPVTNNDTVLATQIVNVSDAVTVSAVSIIDGTFTANLSNFTNAQGVAQYSLGGTLPVGWNDNYETTVFLKKISAVSGQLCTDSGLGTPIIPSTAGSGTIKLCSTARATKMWVRAGTAPTSTNWRSQPSVAQLAVPCQLMGDCPQIIMGYDSISASEPNYYNQMTNRPGNSSIYQEFDTIRYNVTNYLGSNTTTAQQLETGLGWSVLMSGIGQNDSTNALERFAADFIYYNPKIIIVRISYNDIAHGLTPATILANLTAMYNQAAAIGARFYVAEGIPSTALNNTQCQTLDTANALVRAAVANWTYGGWLTSAAAVGQARVGGSPTPPVGNLWDLVPAYTPDGIHLNPLGYRLLADYWTPQIQALERLGSVQGQFTATRGASNPATYFDASGILQKVITSDTPRFTKGYYDSSGFHTSNGLLIEPTSTNYAPRSDGTTFSGGQTSGWFGPLSNVVGTPTYTTPLVPDLSGISGAASQRMQYTGVPGDVNQYLIYGCANSSAGAFVQGDVVTVSFGIRSRTGSTFGNPQLWIKSLDVTNGDVTSQKYVISGIGTALKRYSFTFSVTGLLASRIAVYIGSFGGLSGGIDGINNGQTLDLEWVFLQYEKANFATSFIPTSLVAGLVRNAEKLVYGTTNRTAATETVFLKLSPEVGASELSTAAYMMDTDTKERIIWLNTTNTVTSFPNMTDSGSASVTASALAKNTSIMFTTALSSTGDPNIQNYLAGIANGTPEVIDFAAPAWGPYFYIGTKNDGTIGAPAIYQNAAIYGSVLSSTKIDLVNTVLQ